MIKAVLFDLDGTLVNSLSDLAISTNYALGQLGFPLHELEEFKYFIGDGIPKLIERALPQDKRDGDTKKLCLDLFMGYYREHYVDTTYAYDGINGLLSDLKTSGMKLVVISNKAREMVEKIALKLFDGTFDVVEGKQEGYPAKPDPALTLKVISELGVAPNECVLVGDSGMDMAAAVNAGAVPLGVLWGFRDRAELMENGAEYIADTPSKIAEIISNINVI